MSQGNLEQRLVDLGQANERTNGKGSLPMLKNGSLDWNLWKDWRTSVGMGTAFMEKQPTWCVPCLAPPTDWRT